VKIVRLSLYVAFINNISKGLSEVTSVRIGLVATKNKVDDASFSNALVTKDDDVWNVMLPGGSMRFVIFVAEKMTTTCVIALIICSASELETTSLRRW
jgi:hypothetical protein